MFKLDIKVWNLHLINNDNQLYWAYPNRRMWNLNQFPVHMSEKLSLEMSNQLPSWAQDQIFARLRLEWWEEEPESTVQVRATSARHMTFLCHKYWGQLHLLYEEKTSFPKPLEKIAQQERWILGDPQPNLKLIDINIWACSGVDPCRIESW